MVDEVTTTMWDVILKLPLNIVTGVLTNLALYDLRNVDSAACSKRGRPVLLESMRRYPAVEQRIIGSRENRISILKWIFHKLIQVTNVSLGLHPSRDAHMFAANAELVRSIELGRLITDPAEVDNLRDSCLADKVVVTDILLVGRSTEDPMPANAFPNLRSFIGGRNSFNSQWLSEFLRHHPSLSELELTFDATWAPCQRFLSAVRDAKNLTKLKLQIFQHGRTDGAVAVLQHCGQRLRCLQIFVGNLSRQDAVLIQMAQLCPLLENLDVKMGDPSFVPSALHIFMPRCPHLRFISQIDDLDDAFLGVIGQAGLNLVSLTASTWAVDSASVRQWWHEGSQSVEQGKGLGSPNNRHRRKIIVRHSRTKGGNAA